MASALYFPFGLVVVALCAIAGIRAESLLTFGDRLGVPAGLLAWWLLVVVLSLPYVACTLWDLPVDGFDRRKG